MSYDPARHHRRSIRLKGHDYAGGGVYFVTICAHRESIAAWGGKPFSGVMRALLEERMRITAQKCPQMTWGEWVIMPDHFHALIRMQKGPSRLGVVIGGFKAAVSPLPDADVYFGDWHSPKEKEMLDWLLQNGRRVIACPAWGIENSAFASGVRDALEQNSMLILEMRDTSGNLAAARQRNRFVIQHADTLFIPHVTPGGMLDRLLRER